MANNIPPKVKSAFKPLAEMFGYNNIVHIGTRAGVEYYLYKFPENTDTGFPNVVAFESGNVSIITGFDAVKIVGSF